MKILVLESSTTSAKSLLYDTKTGQCHSVSTPYEFSEDSQALQNPEKVFGKTVKAANEVAKESPVDIILLSATWHSVMLCDRNGIPVTPVELWCYTGASGLCSTLRRNTGFAGDYYRKTGSLVNSTYPYFKLIELYKQNRLTSSCRVGGQGVYNMFKLTGEWVTTQSMASGSGLLDMHTGTYDNDLLDSAGVTEEQLPRIVPYGKTFSLTKAGAELLGQKEGIPVVPAYPDGALNQIGAGALANGIMTFSVGTSAAIRMTTKEFLLPEKPALWSYLVPDAHLLGAATSGACNCQDWVKKKFFPPEKTYADLEHDLIFSRDTPTFLPFLFGERSPGWKEDRKGGFEYLRPEHTLADIYQAVLEGVLFNVYQCYEILVKTAGQPGIIKLSGGIIYSSAWTQMCADIFGKDLTIDRQEQSSLMGGVVIGRHLLGDIDSLISFHSELERRVNSDETAHRLYMEKYSRYLDWYDRLQ